MTQAEPIKQECANYFCSSCVVPSTRLHDLNIGIQNVTNLSVRSRAPPWLLKWRYTHPWPWRPPSSAGSHTWRTTSVLEENHISLELRRFCLSDSQEPLLYICFFYDRFFGAVVFEGTYSKHKWKINTSFKYQQIINVSLMFHQRNVNSLSTSKEYQPVVNNTLIKCHHLSRENMKISP